MKTLTTRKELEECFKGMKQGDKYFKCLIFYDTLGGYDLETYGYALTNDIEEAKRMYFKELEDDEEATLMPAYMAIMPFEYVGPFTNAKGKLCHAKACGEMIINDFGTWKTKKEFYGQ